MTTPLIQLRADDSAYQPPTHAPTLAQQNPLDDFFTPQLLAEARRHWQSNLGTFVAPLPDVEHVLAALRPLIRDVLALA